MQKQKTEAAAKINKVGVALHGPARPPRLLRACPLGAKPAKSGKAKTKRLRRLRFRIWPLGYGRPKLEVETLRVWGQS